MRETQWQQALKPKPHIEAQKRMQIGISNLGIGELKTKMILKEMKNFDEL